MIGSARHILRLRAIALLAASVLYVLVAPHRAMARVCTGDCDGDRNVTVDELVLGVNVALGAAAVDRCNLFDHDASGGVTVDELILAVNYALGGCPPIVARPMNPDAPLTGRFDFDTGEDDVSRALRDLNAVYHMAARSQADVTDMQRKRVNAQAVIDRYRGETVALLIDNYEKLDPRDFDGRDTLLHLIGSVEDSTGLTFLFDQAMRPAPALDPVDVGSVLSEGQVTLMLQQSAVARLGYRAAAGSRQAKNMLLDVVERGSAGARMSAIHSYYGVSRQRWRAQREMGDRLPADQQYLLYKLF